MARAGADSLALLLQSGPYLTREARAELDVALAALALDKELEVYFFGEAIMQLATEKSAGDALLPAGYKGWTALPDLGAVRVYAESDWLRRCDERGIALALPVQGLSFSRMKTAWRGCRHVMVL